MVEPRKKDSAAAFLAWLDRLEDIHVDLGGPPLSNDTLGKAGELPVPNTSGLVRHHGIELDSYARSSAASAIRRRGSESGTAGNRQFYGDVAQFVGSAL